MSHVGADPRCSPHKFLFVGGLQRSGTSTLASLLGEVPGVSGLRFDALDPRHMETAPWKRQVDVHTGTWMKYAYFKEVVATGGAEGKLLQAVYPYRYAVFDAKHAPLRALLAHPTALSPLLTARARAALWADWRRFWPPGRVMLDKSPENVLMAPFLQALFGARRAAFAFVLRHPLCWALVAAKWGCEWHPIPGAGAAAGADAEPAKAPRLECLEHLLDVWFAVHEQLLGALPSLRAAVVLRAEADEWLTAPAPWLRAVGAADAPPPDAAARWAATHASFRRASHRYVHCFLSGWAPRRGRKGAPAEAAAAAEADDPCADGVREVDGGERLRWLATVGARYEARAAAFGYTFRLGGVAASCCDGGAALWLANASGGARGGAGLAPPRRPPPTEAATATEEEAALPSYRAHADDGAGVGLHAGRVALVVNANFLSGFNGMQQRAAQLAAALGKLGFALHYVSLGPLAAVDDCAASEVAVVCHAAGNHTDQFEGLRRWSRERRASPSLVLLGFTSLTLEVSRALLRQPASAFGKWRGDKEPGYDPDHVPKAHRALTLLGLAAAEWPQARVVVFTDDVHFERTRHILAQDGALRAAHEPVLAAAKALELRTYARAALVLAISPADRAAILGAPRTPRDAPPLAVAVLPFAAAPLASRAVTPRAQRERGSMLYVGTCHPVAKAAIVWLLRDVFPHLERLATAAGFATPPRLRLVGNGWLAEAEKPPFAEWAAKGMLELAGKLPDARLAELYQSTELFVSPLRNATGIATKNFHAMGNGLPVLTTAMGTSGLLLPGRQLGLCCDASPTGRWPPSCKRRAAAEAPPPPPPSLADDCRAKPSRMECHAWAAAKAHAAAAGARTLLQAADGGAPPVPERLAAARRAAAAVGGGGARAGSVILRGSADGGKEAAAPPPPAPAAQPSLHASGAMLVADDAEAFAAAAVAAMSDAALWARLSAAGLVQQRMLAPARQSAVLGAALRAPLLLVPPAERACVLFAEAAERAAAHALIAALVRLRVVVHVVLLPAAEQPADEVAVMGWARAQGVFFYAGTAQEQWTALLAAAAAPPPSFAVAAYGSLADFGRQLRHPHCAEKPPGPRCVLAAAGGAPPLADGAGVPGPALAALRALAATPAARAVGAADASVEVDESISLLRLLDCAARAQRLPIVVATTGALPTLRLAQALDEMAPGEAGNDGDGALLRLAVQHETALLGRARAIVAPSEADARALGAVAPAAAIRTRPPTTPADEGDRRWTEILAELLELDREELPA